MKMLMVIIDNRKKEELEIVLQRHGVNGFTEIPEVHGFGSTGLKMGSAAFPESSAIIFAVIDDETCCRVVETIKEFCAQCAEHIKLLHWDVAVEM
jgi:nitrogen regulatory protein PII